MRSAEARVSALLIGATAAWNLAQNTVVPRRAYPWVNAAGSVAAVAAGRRLGLRPDEMGIGPGSLRRGLRFVAPLGGAAAGAIGATAAVPGLRPLFRDERVNRTTVTALAQEVAFRIPVGTALFEETLFRGLLLGWYDHTGGRRAGLTWSSILFGLWHVLPTWQTAGLYRGGTLRSNRTRGVAAVVGGVVLTSAAGALFATLRHRSRSLVAPVALHAAVNVAGYLAAWAAADVPAPAER